MQISIGTDNVNFRPVTVKKSAEFLAHALKTNWSPSIFKDNYRNKGNFLKADCIGLDIDEGLEIEKAIELFKDFKHFILPSQSHRKEKNGVVADRYRVVLFLTRTIETQEEFYATWFSLQEKFPFIDDSCKDPSRFYYPSTECVAKNMQGTTVDPVEPVEEPTEVQTAPPDLEELNLDTQGELSRKTLKFMLEGVRPGSRHKELYKAARDYHQNNYTKEKFLADLQEMIRRTGKWATPKLSAKDTATIEDAFEVDPKHLARLTYERALLFEPVADVLNSDEKFEWLVDGMLSVGGVSIIAGGPKEGKSTLIRQLSRSISRGTPFLGRKTKQGMVYYTALEEQRALLKNQFKMLGLTDQDNIRIHVGSPMSRDILETLEFELDREQVQLLVIDTFLLGLRIKEPNSYAEVNEALTPYRDLARDSGTHILFVHHTNKTGLGSNSISGSKAIHGAVDTAIILRSISTRRFITTNGRGVVPFHEQELIFDSKTQTYKIGKPSGFDEKEDEF